MHYRSLLGALALTVMSASVAGAQIADITKYPDLKGQWNRFVVPGVGGQPSFDQTKSWGPEQEAPLTPEYQKVFEASLADQAAGGPATTSTARRCGPSGMPFMMMAFRPLEFVITPEHDLHPDRRPRPARRIFTDGRDWPEEIEPTYRGLLDRPMDRRGRRRPLRRARGRDPRLQGPARPTTPPACRCTTTISRSSRSASISTRPIRTSCTTRSP